MSRLALADELLDAQLLRTVGTAPYGGADIGECLAVARRVKGTDLGSWHVAWTDLAVATAGLAADELSAGRVETARGAFLRAASYHRTAGVMLMGAPLDSRLRRSTVAQTEAFRQAAALLERPAEVVAIPFEGTTLPGYHFSAGEGPRPTLILLGGYDGTAEELYVLNGAAALARGYHVVAFDGPGQGSALIGQGLTMRADFGPVVGAVIDFLLARPETDPDRIALMGLSLGAFLAPRAAAGEQRLAACIADCGSFDLYAAALVRMPGPVAGGLRQGSGWARAVAERMLGSVARKPTAGWALRRGMLVHGAPTPLAYLDALREYTLAGHAGKITCPTLVCQAEADEISASAPQLVAALECPHLFVRFTTLEGAGDHCEAGARTLFHARAFAWLDAQLAP
ncbi:MAG: alpha/beta hydrolase family protein [Pseudonocardia sp.]